MGKVTSGIKAGIGKVILVVVLTALAPTAFNAITDLSTNGTAPAWVTTILTILVGVVLVFLLLGDMDF